MCGRYVLKTLDHTLYKDAPSEQLRERYNVAPSQLLPIGVGYDEFVSFQRWKVNIAVWGFLPRWMPGGKAQINARAETVHEKPMFRKAFATGRCLVPADGFYEWKVVDGIKQPYYITLEPEFAFAGILTEGPPDEIGFHRGTFAILTTAANAFMEPLHHRMPVILTKDQWRPWLEDGERDLLQPYGGDMQAWPVTRRMNNPRYNEPDSLEPIT